MRILVAIVAAVLFGGSATFAVAQHQHSHHMSTPSAPDARQLVEFPPMLAEETLANMRDDLQTLQEIQMQLGTGHPDVAAKLAESQLGMSSLGLHGAADVSKYMPQGCRVPARRCTALQAGGRYRPGCGRYRRSEAGVCGACGSNGSMRRLSRRLPAKIEPPNAGVSFRAREAITLSSPTRLNFYAAWPCTADAEICADTLSTTRGSALSGTCAAMCAPAMPSLTQTTAVVRAANIGRNSQVSAT